MRMDYKYDVIYRNDDGEQYTFTSCKWFGDVESVLKNFEKETGTHRSRVTDVFRLIRNKPKPIKDSNH